jgi:hypothetical protein
MKRNFLLMVFQLILFSTGLPDEDRNFLYPRKKIPQICMVNEQVDSYAIVTK